MLGMRARQVIAGRGEMIRRAVLTDSRVVMCRSVRTRLGRSGFGCASEVMRAANLGKPRTHPGHQKHHRPEQR
jgi:hypothetical protein